jgi:hypothetical protein
MAERTLLIFEILFLNHNSCFAYNQSDFARNLQEPTLMDTSLQTHTAHSGKFSSPREYSASLSPWRELSVVRV